MQNHLWLLIYLCVKYRVIYLMNHHYNIFLIQVDSTRNLKILNKLEKEGLEKYIEQLIMLIKRCMPSKRFVYIYLNPRILIQLLRFTSIEFTESSKLHPKLLLNILWDILIVGLKNLMKPRKKLSLNIGLTTKKSSKNKDRNKRREEIQWTLLKISVIVLKAKKQSESLLSLVNLQVRAPNNSLKTDFWEPKIRSNLEVKVHNWICENLWFNAHQKCMWFMMKWMMYLKRIKMSILLIKMIKRKQRINK